MLNENYTVFYMSLNLFKKEFPLRNFVHTSIAFMLTIILVRVYEYIFIASKLFVNNSFRFELFGIIYDIWTCMILISLALIPYYLLSLLSRKFSNIFFHILNILFLVVYLALIVVYSERNTPFDHEFFARSAKESWLTSKQMMTSGFTLYLPFIIYISIYFIANTFLKKRLNIIRFFSIEFI